MIDFDRFKQYIVSKTRFMDAEQAVSFTERAFEKLVNKRMMDYESNRRNVYKLMVTIYVGG